MWPSRRDCDNLADCLRCYACERQSDEERQTSARLLKDYFPMSFNEPLSKWIDPRADVPAANVVF